MRRTSVLLVDDQRLFVESLGFVIQSRAADIEVVGIAYGGAEAVRLAEKTAPDVILMDVRMPDVDGVEATRQILAAGSNARIVMLTTFTEDEYVDYARRHGAVGYLLKNMAPAELIDAIRSARRGGSPVSPTIRSATLASEGTTESASQESLIRTLTKREKEVLTLILSAKDNREIAGALGVADQTVRNYISSIYFKLGVESRMQLLKLMDELSFVLAHSE